MLFIAVLTWTGYGYLWYALSAERANYQELSATYESESVRGESATRLRSTIQNSERERAALEGVVRISLLDAAETIEEAGRQAGALEVSIGEATPLTKTVHNLTTYTFVVNAEGSFVALMRTITLFEALPMPSTVEQFEITKTDKTWRLTARLRATLASEK